MACTCDQHRAWDGKAESCPECKDKLWRFEIARGDTDHIRDETYERLMNKPHPRLEA